ncbi:PEP-CTERM sorting domain-containing protein [Massilia sp. Dwa41.01b]|uniref:PEP-CTERM sorting domain-containing protein n=1 Tax=unclassified Massilia TaxID=2609279 RepID=UPI0016004D3F|nr:MULTISPECIES: PEP-CTERM sorting domain-containing protein [unclassified Massilia]QNA89713.1 PEP-CTERM sorting domain-containing protein [Massilia sp. Dwa41.01b]QNB00610.1 PEP-CTERM sorting domain-containing protein [Massilia sp. Se16.2.3]
MNIKPLITAAIFLLMGSAAQAGTIHYGTGTNDPWNSATNDRAMDSAFGAGNWTKRWGFSTGVFEDADFVFLDGGDGNAVDFASFLANNSAVIANWVAAGGRLFLNAAPNVGGSFDMGFGVRLNYPGYAGSVTVTDAGVAAGLTEGGLTTSYWGTSFAHATVSGEISKLIASGDGGTVFGAMQFGKGFVAFGGETTTNFHGPYADAQALRVNALRYVAHAATQGGEVPEPATVALVGMGLLAVCAVRRKAGRD